MDRQASRAEHFQHIRTVHRALASTLDLVFIGGKVIALYAKATGDALRATTDIDALVVMEFGPRVRGLQRLIAAQVISPVPTEPPCRHRLVDAALDVDLVDLDGFTTGGVNPYHRRATAACREFDAGEGVVVRAITPPFFLLTKLVSLRDKERIARAGVQPTHHHDAEDIVSLFVEVDDLVAQIEGAGVLDDVQREFRTTLDALAVHDPLELLDLWLTPNVDDRERIVRDFLWLAARQPR